MISRKDRAIVKRIGDMFGIGARLPEYDEKLNRAFILIHGSLFEHRISVYCEDNVLSLGACITKSPRNASVEFFKHILSMNVLIDAGSFCYSDANDSIYYSLSAPLMDNNSNEYIMYLLDIASKVLDDFVPDILASTNASHGVNKRFNKRTFH